MPQVDAISFLGHFPHLRRNRPHCVNFPHVNPFLNIVWVGGGGSLPRSEKLNFHKENERRHNNKATKKLFIKIDNNCKECILVDHLSFYKM